MNTTDTVLFKNVKLQWRPNFSGAPTKYNRAGGRRSFSINLNPDQAAQLRAEGWNVKEYNSGREDSETIYFLDVFFRYDVAPRYQPRIWMVTSSKRTLLDEDTVGCLDGADISRIDLMIRPYRWTGPTGNTGIKAMVKTMYVTIYEDELDMMYAEEFDESASDIYNGEVPFEE